MVNLSQGDGRYAVRVIDFSAGFTVYTIEKRGKEIKAISLLTKEETDKLEDLLHASFLSCEAPPQADIQMDLAIDEHGVRFGLLVGLGKPRT